MRLVTVRFKKGIRKSIKNSQKLYTYYCPLDVKEGDYVCVDIHRKHENYFGITRVEWTSEVTVKELMALDDKMKPRGVVLFKVPVDDFYARCALGTKKKYAMMAMYNGTYRVKAKKKSDKVD